MAGDTGRPRHRHIRRPVLSARVLVSHRRSRGSDLALATFLAAVAGATNAGGFFALGQYTSHMTGYLSQLADGLALLNLRLAGIGVGVILSFVLGAGSSAFLINWARERHRHRRRQYALPLTVEGVLLLVFAAWGEGWVRDSLPAPSAMLLLLCFVMGLQNATITKISGARIRTTHATGMITDVGIEAGRAVYHLIVRGSPVRANRGYLRTLLRILGAFLGGGVFGAVGFGIFGFVFAIPLGLGLLAISLPMLLPRDRAPPRV